MNLTVSVVELLTALPGDVALRSARPGFDDCSCPCSCHCGR